MTIQILAKRPAGTIIIPKKDLSCPKDPATGPESIEEVRLVRPVPDQETNEVQEIDDDAELHKDKSTKTKGTDPKIV